MSFDTGDYTVAPPLIVYEDVVSLYSKKFVALHDLDFLVEKAKEVHEKAGVISLCEGHSLGTQ